MDIIKGAAPAKKINVAYFEAWNYERECLNMDVDMIDTDRYNTIHFAFVDITNDFKMNLTKVQDQFESSLPTWTTTLASARSTSPTRPPCLFHGGGRQGHGQDCRQGRGD
jgi:GH18 family chitinase